MKTQTALLFIFAMTLTALLRFAGINWDSGAHLHPDERFLTMVATNIRWPQTVQEYFDTHASPLNPHNMGHKFYVYGTWPIVVAKSFAQILHRDTYDGFPLIARAVSAMADTLTAALVFVIAFILTKNSATATLALFLYGISVLPVQLSHFFSVDTFANLFGTATLLLVIRLAASTKKIPWKKLAATALLLGTCAGLAVGAKISSALMLPVVGVSILFWVKNLRTNNIRSGLFIVIISSLAFACVVRLVYPYLFDGIALNGKMLANFKELTRYDSAISGFPPSLQWVGTMPMLFSFLHLFIWGLGLPYGLIALASFITIMFRWITRRDTHHLELLMMFMLFIFTYQSMQFAKAMRYLLPIYPSIAVISAWFIVEMYKRLKPPRIILMAGIILLLIWPAAFISIYARPHSRIEASTWIYTHVPKGSTIAWEHWDDPLPLRIHDRTIYEYKTEQLPMFNPDSQSKWRDITKQLEKSDYIILSSNRVYGGTGNVPERFPQTQRYYTELFSEKLGFTLAGQFVSRPTIPLPWLATCVHVPFFSYGIIANDLDQCTQRGIAIVDDYIDETFTVYDHPKVLIFQNTDTLNASQMYERIYRN